MTQGRLPGFWFTPVTVAAQRWTFTNFHLLSPDIRASGHLEFNLVKFNHTFDYHPKTQKTQGIYPWFYRLSIK